MSRSYSAIHPHAFKKKKKILYKTEGFQTKYYSEHYLFFLFLQRMALTLFLQAKPQQIKRKIISLGFQSVC